MTFQRFFRDGLRLAVPAVIGMALGGCSLLSSSPATPAPSRQATSIPATPAPPTSLPLTAAPPDDTPTPAPSPSPISPVQSSALALIQAFTDAPYRVVAVARNPHAPYTLIIATERSGPGCGSPEAPQRCTNDETCGSLYTSPTCFFFVEPSFDASADPLTRFVSRWPDEPTLSALATDSIRFINDRTVEFQAAGGDGAYSVQEVWWLDLVTGAAAMQSRVENTP